MTITQCIRCLLPGTLLFLVVSATGCVGPAMPHALSLKEVGQDEVIVVGKIVVDPPLDNGEQNVKTVSFSQGLLVNPNARDYQNKVLLLTDRTNRRITDPSIGDYKGRIEAELGETFYVHATNEPLYVVRSEILMSITRSGIEKALLPSGYRIDLRPGDRAVYIGTIKYHRDEFFSTDKVEVIDEYKNELAAFRSKFGNSIKLRKAIAVVRQ